LFVIADTNAISVTATGAVYSATLNRNISRSVQVSLETDTFNPYKLGMLGKSGIQLTGNSFMDSFDSTDPTKSTSGVYDPSKALANITVGKPWVL
jgi:hypothetical protein